MTAAARPHGARRGRSARHTRSRPPRALSSCPRPTAACGVPVGVDDHAKRSRPLGAVAAPTSRSRFYSAAGGEVSGGFVAAGASTVVLVVVGLSSPSSPEFKAMIKAMSATTTARPPSTGASGELFVGAAGESLVSGASGAMYSVPATGGVSAPAGSIGEVMVTPCRLTWSAQRCPSQYLPSPCPVGSRYHPAIATGSPSHHLFGSAGECTRRGLRETRTSVTAGLAPAAVSCPHWVELSTPAWCSIAKSMKPSTQR